MIQVQGVTKRMGRTLAVNGLSFTAADGTINGLVGRNGAGKTTTLRLIAGVLPPDAGSIRVNDVDPNVDVHQARRSIGALLDHTGLYGRLTARETLMYFGRLRHLPRQQLRERVIQVIDTLGLSAIAERRVAGFSQGELIKLALGCAMLHEPTHVLLDEPTNGLDPGAIVSFRDQLKRLRDSGVCIIFSSHVLSEVQELCDRIVVIANGSVAQQGTVKEICRATGEDTLERAFLKLTAKE
jgi:sodium transport system ATP-binding protein